MSLLDEDDALEILPIVLEQQLGKNDNLGRTPLELDANGNDIGIFLVVEEVAELREDERHLRESGRKLHTVGLIAV